MIFGIGIDILEIERVRASVARFGDRFAQRILGPRELERYRARGARSPERGLKFLATRFAAKEAVSKALGLGMRMPMTWRAVEIVNDASGRPVALVTSAELRRFTEHRHLQLHVSVTDEREIVMAYAVAEVQGAA